MNFRAKNLLFLSLAFVGLLTLDGCVKKSVDDPVISFRSRTNRLKGNWEVESINIQNDISLLNYEVLGKSDFCQAFYYEQFTTISQTFDFKDNGTLEQSMVELDYVFNDTLCVLEDRFNAVTINATWEFNEDETVIFVSAPGQSILEYQIQRLSNSELELTYETLIDFDPVDMVPAIPSFQRATMKLTKN